MKLCQGRKMSIFKKDKDRKYFISYPTLAMRHVKAIRGLYFMLIWNFIGEGKTQKERFSPLNSVSKPNTYI